MKRKDLQHLKLNSTSFPTPADASTFSTIDGVTVKRNYSEEDITVLSAMAFAAGFPPFVRGITPTMYVTQPWQIQQSIDESTIEATNSILRQQLTQGNKTLVLKLDVPFILSATDKEYVPFQKGLLLNTVEDMKQLVHELPLTDIHVTIDTASSILPLLAFYIVAVQEEGIDIHKLTGRIQYDGLQSNLNVSKVDWFPQHVQSVVDSVNYLAQHVPKFNAIAMSNRILKQLEVTAETEVAYSLAQGLAYVKRGLARNLPIDVLASHSFFSWTTNTNFFMEIAKMRASRLIWTKLLCPLKLKNEQLAALSIYAQTTTENQSNRLDCLTRTTVEASAAVFGGMQSLSTPIKKEENSPSIFPDLSAVQYFLQEEIKSGQTVDPWAGSYYVEKLTLDIADKAWMHLQDMDQQGGLTSALITDIMQSKCNQMPLQQETVKNSTAITINQKNKVQRDEQQVQQTLHRLTSCVRTGEGNLLALTIEAAKARATSTEIQKALD